MLTTVQLGDIDQQGIVISGSTKKVFFFSLQGFDILIFIGCLYWTNHHNWHSFG